MTSPKRPALTLPADPSLAPSPLPFGPALARGAALALAIGVSACGGDDDVAPMIPADMGQRDLGSDGFIAPMPPPIDLGGGGADLGPTDLGIIAPMDPPPDMGAPPVDLGIIAPMPPPIDPPPMPAPMPPMPAPPAK